MRLRGSSFLKTLFLLILMASGVAVARADAGFFAGITYLFGARDGLGITLKATSSREEDKTIASAGVSIFPWQTGSVRFGIDVGVGYQGQDSGLVVGWDILNQNPTFSLGYVDTRP